MLLRSALALTGGNRADAEDLVQVTLIKTFQAWDRVSDLAALDTYVRRAMVNTHISTWRRRRVDEYPTDELPDLPVGDHTEAYDLQDVVQRALDRLPRQMRAAVVLRYYDDLTEPEVSRTLGITVGTVKSTVARALAKLRADEQLRTDIAAFARSATFRVPEPRPGAGPDQDGNPGRRTVPAQRAVPRGARSALSAGLPNARQRGTITQRRRTCESQRWRRQPVDSTMMDIPLTVTSIMRYGTTVFGDKEVVTCAAPEPAQRRSYAHAGERAARLASALRGLGVDGDQRIGTFMWNNAEHLEAYLAVPSMGAVLHTLNIRLSPDQVGYIATHAGDHAVIVDESLVPLFTPVLEHAADIRHVIVTGDPAHLSDHEAALGGGGRAVHSYDELLAAGAPSFAWPTIDERSAAAMCYTSGTTGLPKGVVYSHRSTYLHSMAPCMTSGMGISERDRVLPVVPMFHANAWGLAYAALLAGADLVMPDKFMIPAAIAALIETEKVTLGAGVPTIWGGLLAHLRSAGGDVSSLRYLVCGGSALPESMMRAYEAEFGVTMLHAWGMTELSPLGSLAHPPVGVAGEEEWEYRTSQGRLFCTVEGRLTGDNGTALPADGKAVGELEVRGPWITGSYYKDPAPEKFHDGWLRTGDVGTLDDRGFLRLTDRAKDVIKSGGEWISSMELENLLMGHPSVAEAAVIGVPDDKWGERPLATVVPVPGAAVTTDELHAYLAERLPKWQVPERWAFIAEVPKTSVGKFSKVRMREAYHRGDYDVIQTQ
jgi:fatty-acyl-CoA synthase